MTIHFNIEGLGDIHSDVVLQQTRVAASTQGKAEVGQIVVRDIGQDVRDFPLGKRVTINKDPHTNIYGGYLIRARRRFWFSVDLPDTLQRRWTLDVVSNDVLFQKRIVYNVAIPKTIEGPSYTTDTYDDDIIDELVTNWLDLSADGIDVTSLVNRVAFVNDGQTYYPFNGGMVWGQAMATIAALPAATWGLTPDWELYYGDVDEPDAPFGLSNNPNGTTFKGYRESTIVDDLMNGVNDFLAYGFGQNYPNRVFSRETNAASVTEHGLWQDAIVNYNVWKQATINRIADAAVNGSPSSKRGRKDPRILIEAATHEDGLRVGQKVRFIDSTHGFDDVIPIRQMELTFPGPDVIRYDMKLTHEIDATWNSIDPPPFIPIKTPPGWTPIYVVDHIDWPEEEVIEEEGEEGCGLDISIPFEISYRFRINMTGTGTTTRFHGLGILIEADQIDDFEQVYFEINNNVSPFTYNNDFHAYLQGIAADGNAMDQAEADALSTSVSGSWHRAKLRVETGAVKAKVWNESTSEPDWQLEAVGDEFAVPPYYTGAFQTIQIYTRFATVGNSPVGSTIDVDYIQIDDGYSSTPAVIDGWTRSDVVGPADLNSANWHLTELAVTEWSINANSLRATCSASRPNDGAAGELIINADVGRFDNFNRLVASGWGVSTSGYAWSTFGGTMASVDEVGTMTYSAYPTGADATQFQYAEGSGGFSGTHTATIVFSLNGVDTTNVARLMVQYIDSVQASGGQVLVEVSTVNGRMAITGTASGNTVTKTDWEPNTDYALRIERDITAETIKAKLWAALDPEPSAWDVEHTGWLATNPLGPTGWFAVSWGRGRAGGTLNQGGSRTIYFRYIDFDYAGKPCYLDCSGGAECYIGSTTTTQASPVTTVDVNVPSGTLDGDVLLVHIAKNDNDPVSTPAGWTQIGGSALHSWYYRVAASEPASYTFPVSVPGDRVNGYMHAFRGIDTDDPIAGFAYGSDSGTTHNSPGISLAAGDYVLLAAVELNRGAVTFTPPSGFTILTNGDTGSSADQHTASADAMMVYTGENPPTVTWTSSGSTGSSNNEQIALRGACSECAEVPPGSEGSTTVVPTSGSFCEVLAYTNGTTYNTSARFIGGSQTVTVNSLTANPGADPAGQYLVAVSRQAIQFHDPYAPDDVVNICYVVD